MTRTTAAKEPLGAVGERDNGRLRWCAWAAPVLREAVDDAASGIQVEEEVDGRLKHVPYALVVHVRGAGDGDAGKAERAAQRRSGPQVSMWVLKVYIIPSERAIEHFPQTTSRTCVCSRTIAAM